MNESICPIFSENTFIAPDIEAYRFVDSKSNIECFGNPITIMPLVTI